MTQMVYEVFDALKSINVSDEKATAVAKALGNQDAKLNEVKFELKEEIRELRSELKAQIDGVRAEVREQITAVKSDIKVIYWMLGVLVTMNVGLFWMVFRISQSLP